MTDEHLQDTLRAMVRGMLEEHFGSALREEIVSWLYVDGGQEFPDQMKRRITLPLVPIGTRPVVQITVNIDDLQLVAKLVTAAIVAGSRPA